MSRLSRICAAAVLLLTWGEALSATEKFAFIRSADAVVVGQLKLSSYFLSFDGLHVNGTIVATEILYGDGHPGTAFYQGVWQHWSETKETITNTQIWALYKGPGPLWTAGDPKLAFIHHLTDREEP